MKQITQNLKRQHFKAWALLLPLFCMLLGENIFAQNCNGVMPVTITALNNPTICKDSSISVMLSTAAQAGASYQWVKNAEWQNVGIPDFSAGDAAYTSIAVDSSGTPYVVYSDDAYGGKATVKKYDGANWVSVGTEGFSSDLAFYTSIAISDSNIVYVAFFDGGNGSAASVMKFDGANWVYVGNPGFTFGSAAGTRIAIDHNEVPYVAYTDYYDTLNVMKFDGLNWNLVGSGPVSAGATYSPSLAIAPDNTPYVAYADDAGYYLPTVKKFDGANWVQVGAPGFITDTADDVEIAINDSGSVYLTYGNYADNFRTNAWKYDGTNWTRVGQPNFSALTEDWLSMKLDGSGTPYIAYQDGAYGQKITVKKFDGTNWVDVGSHGFSPDLVYYSTIAISRDGIPYVAFNNYGNAGKATVMKFDGQLVGIDSSGYMATDTACYTVRVKTCKGAYSLNTMCIDISDLSATATQTNVTCNGGGDGSATIQAVGGVAPFIYSWNIAPVQMFSTISGVPAGTYTGEVLDSNMCPASVTVIITEPPPVDTSVTVSGIMFTANSSSATFQWIDCGNGNAIISGETGSSFTPTADGSYAVTVTENGTCINTSGCFTITGVGIHEMQDQINISAYPNPNAGTFTIKTNTAGTYRLLNELGEVVKEIYLTADSHDVTLSGVANGVYYLTLQNDKAVFRQKIVVLGN